MRSLFTLFTYKGTFMRNLMKTVSSMLSMQKPEKKVSGADIAKKIFTHTQSGWRIHGW